MLAGLLSILTLVACQNVDDKLVEAADRHGCSKHDNNWLSWGRDLANTRSNPDSKVAACNVGSLSLSWLTTLNGDLLGGPALEDGFLYATDSAGGITKVRETDGNIIWQKNIEELTGFVGSYSRTTPIVLKDRIIVGIRQPAQMIALDKATGNLLWSTNLDMHPAAIITQSGTSSDGVVYVGVSSFEEVYALDPTYPCCSFVGSMNALSTSTGALLWKTKMMPDSISGLGKFAGCAIWGSAPAVDDKYVYIATGNLYSLTPEASACQTACDDDPSSCVGKPPCVPEDVHFDSVLALHRSNGKIRWATRLEATDAWTVACALGVPENCPLPTGPDYDFGQAPTLVNKHSLVIGQKSGVFWNLDRCSGKVNWSKTLGPGGNFGGYLFGSTLLKDVKVNGKTRKVFVGLNANSMGVPIEFQGQTWTGGLINAVDAETGETLWQTGIPSGQTVTGALSSSKDVIFAPMYHTGQMQAYSVYTGNCIYTYQTNATIMAGATIGKDTVYLGNGYLSIFSGTPGRNLYALKL